MQALQVVATPPAEMPGVFSPRVSICIPSYNLGYCIAETIQSVLNQTFTDFELLIEDDGSTDDSVSVISTFNDPRIRFTPKTRNEGANRTTNNQVSKARGEYICLLPADDVWEPEKLTKQVAYLDANPACGIVFGHPRFMDQRGAPIKYPQEGIENIGNDTRLHWRARLQGGNCLFIATSMYRRALHEELGLFSEELSLLADLEWYIRIVKDHDLHIIQEPLARVRLRDGGANLSAMNPKTMEVHCDELDVIRERHWPVDRAKKKYLFATPFYEVKGYAPYIVSMFQTVYALARHTKVEFEFNELSGDSYVWRARNLLAERFLLSDATHLIFIDSDEAWSLESIMRLLKADVDVVGAAYPSKNNWEHYSVVVYTDANGIPETNAEGLIRAQKVPCGFMKIKREVFETLKKKYPENWYWEGGNSGAIRKMYDYFGHLTIDHVKQGEDISFCKRCEMAGIELWVEPRADIDHIGTKTWKGNYHKYLTRLPGGSADPKRAVNDSTSSEAA